MVDIELGRIPKTTSGCCYNSKVSSNRGAKGGGRRRSCHVLVVKHEILGVFER